MVDENRLTEVIEFGSAGEGLGSLVHRLAPFLGTPVPNLAPRHAAISRIKDALSIRRLGLSNAVEIGFTSRDPLRSATIANAIAQGYIAGQTELMRKTAADSTSRLREILTEIRDKAFAIDPPLQGSVLTTPEAGAQAQARVRELQNRAETYRVLYNSLLQRSFMESIDPVSLSGARVISPADAPAQRSWPRAVSILAIFAACGAIGGMGRALLRQATDRSLRTVEDVQRLTRPNRVIGVSKIRRWAWKIEKSRRKDLQLAYVRGSAGLHLAMSKLAATSQGKGRRSGWIMGVAAPTPGAGASSVAAHLARIIAETGQKTLLIDANWQKPSIAPAAPNENPSRTLARTPATIPIEPVSLDVLTLRPAGSVSELRASLSIFTTLHQLRAECDWMAVDFHSAKETVDLEACMSALDEVIVVAEARQVSSEDLRNVLRLIPAGKIATVVLNKI
ncbi:MAG: hypothetical protein JO366_02915 [Methylobacteriaceae bacterium]|nr:hypothetical protein [Methylobacteriaceae bacterium]